MALGAGFDAQTPSLPRGGGAVGGLGETFTPDLSTGTGSYAIRLDWPNGPNDIGPRLALRYDTGQGNGPFGLGFSLPLPRLVRSTAKGHPRYRPDDPLMLEGAGELLAQGDGSFRLRVDAGAWRVRAEGDGFLLTDRDGNHHRLGTTAAGRQADGGRVFAWHLEQVEDPLGNMARFAWGRNEGQLYLDTVTWGAFAAHFTYEPRPDPVRSGRSGFPVVTALRCTAIELHRPSEAQPLLRRWQLSYDTADNGCSLLREVLLTGFGADGAGLDAPPLRLSYTGFAPRTLTRIRNAGGSAGPGPLTPRGQRVELVDWNADGLPDLLEVAPDGAARLWPNAGEGSWGRPRSLGRLAPLAAAGAALGLIDMDGDGVADLVRLDRSADSYIPRTAGGGFGRPVMLREAPSVPIGAPGSRLVDLDGDGVPDLLTPGGEGRLLMFHRREAGWDPRPRVVPAGEAPDVDLADPHVFLANMTGDGMADLVRVTGGGVVYWPYLGTGRWDAPRTMADPPALPFDLRPERILLGDIDGDGCADLIVLDHGRVLYWINQGGVRFAAPRTIANVPTGGMGAVRLADMRGSGAPGLLWSSPGPMGGARYWFLDFMGDAKPYLLRSIDNGLGLTTTIDYTTSAREAARDARSGTPWSTPLPVVVPVVAAVRDTDTATGLTAEIRFRYRDGRYDGVLREFAGFAHVEEDRVGDAGVPTLRTVTRFHVGTDPGRPGEPRTLAERHRLRALRGRLLRQERFGLDGSARQGKPYDRLDQGWSVTEEQTPGGTVLHPRLMEQTRTTFEREDGPAHRVSTRNLAWDAHGNLTETEQTAEVIGEPAATRVVRTVTAYAEDPVGRFQSLPWRVRQFDGAGTPLSDGITLYDDQPEGRVGARGLVTRRSALILTDALVAEIYGDAAPDLAALGHHRRAGEEGWWIEQARYERTDDAAGLRGRVTGPLGAVTELAFDADRTFPAKVVDPHGNTVSAEHDPRVGRVRRLTDASGAVAEVTYDALARLSASAEPGDSPALPTVSHRYDHNATPTVVETDRRAVSGQPGVIAARAFYDGAGRLLERRVLDEAGEVVVESVAYNARGLIARAWQPHRPASAAYVRPDDAVPHSDFLYDALGRLVEQRHPDGSFASLIHEPGFVEERDEEGTSTIRRLDANGRPRRVEQSLGPRVVATGFEHDPLGNMVRQTDALGHEVRLWHDLLGRTLRVRRPEQETLRVLDAAGNAVETRTAGGTPVFHSFDACGRPTAMRFGDPAAVPVVRFTYHDAGRPAPADAGAHTSGGRCVRIDDQAGTTVFDYDARGRLAVKLSTPTGSAQAHRLDFVHRADGQLASVTYPDGGAGRLTLRHEYDRRGQLLRVPGVVSAIERELDGRRRTVRLANGTAETYGYDARRRLASMRLDGAGGELRAVAFTVDGAGNLRAIDSPDPALAMTCDYDGLYRLTSAQAGDGAGWTYAYDDAGNLTFKSDVGAMRYGEGGAPPTALTSAGMQAFTYAPAGGMLDTPWGRHDYDPLGRLVGVTTADAGVTMLYAHDGSRAAVRTSGTAAPAVDRLTPDPLYAIENGALVLHLFDGDRIVARRTAGGTRFLHADHLGSLAVVTDAAGAVVDRLRHDPFGRLIQRAGPGPMEPFGFATGEFDAWPGLLYLRGRYYHPGLGRFVSPDMVVGDPYDPLAWAAYAYARDNPLSRIDPSGRNAVAIFLSAVVIGVMIAVAILCPPMAGAILIGMAIGGLTGGLAAAKEGGSAREIVTGVFVGAAVGGVAAYIGFGALAGAKAAAGLGLAANTAANSIVAGAINGAINGAAMGFAAGYAGGVGSGDEVMRRIWQRTLAGAAVGAATGALLGAAAHLTVKPMDPAAASQTQPTGGTGGPTGVAEENSLRNDMMKDMLYRTGDTPPPSGLESLGKQLESKAPEAAGELFKRTVGEPSLADQMLRAGFVNSLVQTPVVDLAAGTVSILFDDIVQYVRTHEIPKIGPVKAGGSF